MKATEYARMSPVQAHMVSSPRALPRSVAALLAFACLASGLAHCGSDSADGELSPEMDSGAAAVPDGAPSTASPEDGGDADAVVAPARVRIVALAVGGRHGCALSASGAVKCWGQNTSGQLGLGDALDHGDQAGEMGDALAKVDLGIGRTARALAAGDQHTCALLDDGSVKCWGANDYGQLGLGDVRHRGMKPGEMGDALPAVALGMGRRAAQIFAAHRRTCAVLDDGALKCWGVNEGSLGLGDTAHRGDGPNEMGDNLPAVDLGAGRRAISLAMYYAHTCAVLDDATMKCWGANDKGQLGLTLAAGKLGDAPNEMGDNLKKLELGTGRSVRSGASGLGHTCALLDNDDVKCWGYNGSGQLGLGDVGDRGDAAGEMGNALPVTNLGVGKVTRLAAGSNHTCAIFQDQTVKCWGENIAGQLGLGDKAARGAAPGQMGSALPSTDVGTGEKVVALGAGVFHTCALLASGGVKCWGQNVNGELGLGDTVRRGDGAGQMGDALPLLDLGRGW